MPKRHLKRLRIPITWKVRRRKVTFITRPFPGSAGMSLCVPLKIIVRDILGLAQTSREAKYIALNKTIMVDGKRRKELKFPVGLMDVVEFPDIKARYRIVLTGDGKLMPIAIDESQAGKKLCKVIGKRKVKGKTQVNFHDSKNLLVDKEICRVGDSILVSLPNAEIQEVFPLKKGALVLLIKGKLLGSQGTLEGIQDERVIFKDAQGKSIETLKEYVFVIGTTKPAITLEAGK